MIDIAFIVFCTIITAMIIFFIFKATKKEAPIITVYNDKNGDKIIEYKEKLIDKEYKIRVNCIGNITITSKKDNIEIKPYNDRFVYYNNNRYLVLVSPIDIPPIYKINRIMPKKYIILWYNTAGMDWYKSIHCFPSIKKAKEHIVKSIKDLYVPGGNQYKKRIKAIEMENALTNKDRVK